MLRRVLALGNDGADVRATVTELALPGSAIVNAQKIAQMAARGRSAAEREELRQEVADLEEWRSGPGVAAVEAAAAMLGTTTDVVAVPCVGGAAVYLHNGTDEGLKAAADVVANAMLHAGGEASLTAACDTGWRHLNAAVLERQCPPCCGVQQKLFCRKAGFCICDAYGKQLQSMREGIYSLIKPRAPAHSPGRAALKDGHWAIYCEGFTQPAADSGDAPMLEDEMMLHIAYMCLAPWRATWHALRLCSPPNTEPPVTMNRLYSEAAIGWMSVL